MTRTTRTFPKIETASPRAAKASGKLFKRVAPPGKAVPHNQKPETIARKRNPKQLARDAALAKAKRKASPPAMPNEANETGLRDALAIGITQRMPGRGVKFTEERKKLFMELYSNGLSVRQSAIGCGISPQTAYDYIASDPTFAEEYTQATDRNTEMLEATLHEIGHSGHVGALLAVLKQRRPHRWREVSRTELTGKDGKPVEVEQREVRRSELMETILAAVAPPKEVPQLEIVKK